MHNSIRHLGFHPYELGGIRQEIESWVVTLGRQVAVSGMKSDRIARGSMARVRQKPDKHIQYQLFILFRSAETLSFLQSGDSPVSSGAGVSVPVIRTGEPSNCRVNMLKGHWRAKKPVFDPVSGA